MNSSLRERLWSLAQTALAGLRGLGFLQQRRRGLAASVRQVPGKAHSAYLALVGLLFLVGMTSAGLVLLPVGVFLLADSLLRESVDRALLGGLVLCGTGLFYLFVPAAIVHLAGQALQRRLQRQAERLAERIAGPG